jgi:uncharacterized protein
VTVLDSLAADDLSRVTVCFRDALRDHQDELNRLNVYPVPDGDTGTNMALTVESVVAELDGAHDMGSVCSALTHGSLMGARGNSGVILSQVLRGLAEAWRERAQVGARDVAIALRRAADAAYDAVLRPVEGTILTVVRQTAEACEARLAACGAGGGRAEPPLDEMVDVASSAAAQSLAETPELLAVLAENGVVDAGAKGFTLLLDALGHVVTGRPVPTAPAFDGIGAPAPIVGAPHAADSVRYEVMCFLEAPSAAMSEFKRSWGEIGESIVVTGGEGLYNCHIHTDDIGAAIEAAVVAGRPHQIRVTDLRDESQAVRGADEAPIGDRPAVTGGARAPVDASSIDPAEPALSAVVAVASGAGVRELMLGLGAAAIVAGGQTMNPSTADLLGAVLATGADHVIVLPNNKNIVPVAQQLVGLAELGRQSVHVVPTHSITAGLAALVPFDAGQPGTTNHERMAEAAGRCRTAEITRAVRDATTDAGPVRAGQWLALAQHRIVGVDDDPVGAVLGALTPVVHADSELVTILVGADVGRDLDAVAVDMVRDAIASRWPGIEIEVLEGGQPHYPFVIGVE